MPTFTITLVRNQTGKVQIIADNEEQAHQLISNGQYTEPEWETTDFYTDNMTS